MLLLRETRCGVDEVRHYGSVAIATSGGSQLYGEHPPDSIPLRSTGKPFFLGALLETILRDEHFESDQLALMSSSHNGEPQHVTVLLELLQRYGISPELLQCGTHAKWREWSVHGPTGNNCSGKHAAFLIAGSVAGYNISTYLDPNFPVHRIVVEKISEAFGQPPSAAGVDGCSLPTYSYPLDAMARAIRAYAMDELGEGYVAVRKAMVQSSFYVAGTDRLESYLIGRYGLSAKSGSDGLWVLGSPSSNIGIAVKVWSGVEAATQAVLLDILHNRAVLDVRSDRYLATYHNRAVLSLAGVTCGEIKVCFREPLEL